MSLSRPRVTHIIMSLGTGGAEESLRKLTSATRDEFRHCVVSLGAPSYLSRQMENDGTQVFSLDVKRRGPVALWQAWRTVQRLPPDVLQGWMYHGNLLAAALFKLCARRSKLVWNIRHSPQVLADEKPSIRVSLRMARFFTPHLVIYNSHDGKAVHANMGYARFASVVIPNGVDPERFKPSADIRARVRSDTNGHDPAANEPKWVGLVGRFHPDKGIGHFLRAVHELRSKNLQFKALLAGPGMDAGNHELVSLIEEVGLQQTEIDCRGSIEDTSLFLPALDVLVVASVREGMPNVLLEAMACGVTTVATKVGDVERILTHHERLATAGDAHDLADKIAYALSHLGVQAEDRAHVQRHFNLVQCNAEYCATYAGLLA